MRKKTPLGRILGVLLALLGIFLCFRLTVSTAKNGYSRLLSTVVMVQSRIELADHAITITPDDPEAHYTRALTLVNNEKLHEAVTELQTTIRLRPHHYYEWLDLGVTLDQLDDQDAAIAAIKQSVRLAPSFAQPRWQLGSLLFRQGKYEDAFVELRYGAESNSSLFDQLLDLAWIAAAHDVARMEGLVKPQTKKNHLALARYLAKQGKGADAVRHVREAGASDGNVDQPLFRQVIAELLTSHQFSDAHSAWEIAHRINRTGKAEGQVVNGNFSDPIFQNDIGFGWQLSPTPAVSASIDPSGPISGTRSINFSFNGASDPQSPLMSQIVLLQPKTRYGLKFMGKTDSLVTGGPALIVMLDAVSGKILGQSALPTGTSEWKPIQIDFSTEEDTLAGVIALQRLNCSETPCPVFGRLWLSNFAIRQ